MAGTPIGGKYQAGNRIQSDNAQSKAGFQARKAENEKNLASQEA
jgi:hypothetical protein